MKIKILAICLMFVLPLSAHSDEKAQLAVQIMELTKVKRLMEQMKDQVNRIQHQLLSQYDIPEEKRELAKDFQSKINDKVFEVMSWDEIEREYLELFTSTYSIEELRGLLAFYQSPVGKSMIEKQPLIMEKAMLLSQKRVQALIPELEKITAEFEKALYK